MADSSYPYAPDQFDEEAAAASYHGAHRAEEPFWRQNLVYLIIIGVAALVLLGLLLVIGGLRGGSDDRAADPTSSPAQSAAVSDGGGDGYDRVGEAVSCSSCLTPAPACFAAIGGAMWMCRFGCGWFCAYELAYGGRVGGCWTCGRA